LRFVKTRAKRAQELPEGSGLLFGFQVSNVDCLPEVFPWFCGSFQGLVGLVFGFQVSNMDCLCEVFPGFCGSFHGLVAFLGLPWAH
jgi:hypothetical protein